MRIGGFAVQLNGNFGVVDASEPLKHLEAEHGLSPMRYMDRRRGQIIA